MSASRIAILLAGLAVTCCATGARGVEASAPRGTTLNVYDTGFALVSELRSIVFSGGEDTVVLRQVPARIDPSTVSLAPVAGGRGLDVFEQRFEYDLGAADRMFRRYLERPIRVGAREGRLLGVPAWREASLPSQPLHLAMADGSVLSFYSPAQAGEVSFPDAGKAAYLEPTLVYRARSAQEGPQNVRLSYLADGVEWQAAYDLVLGDADAEARLAARVALRNRSGGRFQEARVKLILTEKGHIAPMIRASEGAGERGEARAQRYTYGIGEPQAERAVASLAPVETYELPRAMTLDDEQEAFVQIAWTERLPVSRFYVYDGVRFDRFQRNRRNDWNYGTEFGETVDTHLEFQNATDGGLGFSLPPGRLNLYQARADGTVDLLGSDYLAAVAAGKQGQVRVGPARGLKGERERTGYSEVKPLTEYEESFEIRLANDSDAAVQVRVVEHLYRWHDYEIVKADAEYTTIAPQTIEFRPDLKPGGRRSLHYTVRYRW